MRRAALLALPALALLLLAAHLLHSGAMPHVRLAVILGSVTLFTALAAVAFQNPVLRAYFGLPTKAMAEPGTR
jgi:hypothetical protein